MIASMSSKSSRIAVEFDDDEIRHHRRDGVQESIQWSDLHEVGILTTDEGPFVDDVIWMLLDSTGKAGCAIPSNAPGMETLVARIHELPGFNSEAVLAAMVSTENTKFLCWTREVG
ncbi:MAG: hypothetical protein JW751_10455 [Polyangiaceae bacterium]|nr:hypothetical protein [Polyangiaceae bacterium]